MGTYARNPVEFVRGEGTRLWDAEGNEYLDFLGGISVAQIGHAHPHWVDAVSEQAGRLAHVGNLFYTEPAMRLAERLSKRRSAARSSSPTRAPRRTSARSSSRASASAGAASSCSRARSTGARTARCRRRRRRRSRRRSRRSCRASGRPARRPGAVADAVDGDTAAVFLEPIQGESGIHPISEEMLRAAREACDRAGALLIFDEIQCGMGRTGTLWAWQHVGSSPT